jgi:hypothetical protein
MGEDKEKRKRHEQITFFVIGLIAFVLSVVLLVSAFSSYINVPSAEHAGVKHFFIPPMTKKLKRFLRPQNIDLRRGDGNMKKFGIVFTESSALHLYSLVLPENARMDESKTCGTIVQ